MITIGHRLVRKVLNNYIYMISNTTIDNNKILTKNIISKFIILIKQFCMHYFGHIRGILQLFIQPI